MGMTKSTWHVIIKRLDKSTHRYSEVRAHAPRRGDVLETVVAGMLVKAEVEVVYPKKISVGPERAWVVHAEEI
jgi:hypothetical protein